MIDIDTDRLVLRHWRETDLTPWAQLNADPEVCRYLGPPLTVEQAAASARDLQQGLDRNGFGFWAVEVRASGEFIGFAGLDIVDDAPPFTGVEVGWRLARAAWGHGYATEAARAALEYGFHTVGLAEIFAIAAATNLRSVAVMRRLGMTHDPAKDFDDATEDDEALRRQVVYAATFTRGG